MRNLQKAERVLIKVLSDLESISSHLLRMLGLLFTMDLVIHPPLHLFIQSFARKPLLKRVTHTISFNTILPSLIHWMIDIHYMQAKIIPRLRKGAAQRLILITLSASSLNSFRSSVVIRDLTLRRSIPLHHAVLIL